MPIKVLASPTERPEPLSPSIPGACSMVIFGATGDLTARKLMPALHALGVQNLLPACFSIVGVGRQQLSEDEFRRRMREALERQARFPLSPEDWERLESHLYYMAVGDEVDTSGYGVLRDRLAELDRACGTEGNRLFYLATTPDAFAGIVQALGAAGLARQEPGRGWTRIIVEKPFGRDLASARDLNDRLLKVFAEHQIYRIDHYLGKETVQNILSFRFGNSIFEPLWNRRYIDHVQLTVAEELGIEGRGRYYDSAGALRDMVQNHLLQLLALIAMEPPSSFGAESIRDEKVKLLRAIPVIPPSLVSARTVRGQYTAGQIDRKRVEAYANEPGVSGGSTTETFVALKLDIENWRWAGVPVYLRTGKALAKRISHVTIEYREPPLLLFRHAPHADHEGPERVEPNRLTLRIQPDEGITLRFGLKPPGERFSLVPVVMDFGYDESFGHEPPEAYERLLLDCMRGDATLFIRRDEIEAAWAWITPILQVWEQTKQPPYPYMAGIWGPREAEELMARDGRRWVKH